LTGKTFIPHSAESAQRNILAFRRNRLSCLSVINCSHESISRVIRINRSTDPIEALHARHNRSTLDTVEPLRCAANILLAVQQILVYTCMV
jgi:hypothetical protein